MCKVPSEKAARTRQEILSAAVSLFRSRGVDAVSISNIMGTLGMTPGGFYKYFGSKDALIHEAIQLAFEDALNFWQSSAEKSADSSPIRSLTSAYLAIAEKGLCPVLAFCRDASVETHGASLIQEYRVGVERLLNTSITAALASGRNREEAMGHFAAMLGAGLLIRIAGSERWAREVAEATGYSMDSLASYPSFQACTRGNHEHCLELSLRKARTGLSDCDLARGTLDTHATPVSSGPCKPVGNQGR